MRALNLATPAFPQRDAARTWPLPLLGRVLVAVTAKHAFVVRALLPDRTSALHDEVDALEAEAARLRAEAGGLRGPAPDAALVARWSLIKDLVDQRTFSWTRLLARLEKVIPEGVRIAAIAPTVRRGEVAAGPQRPGPGHRRGVRARSSASRSIPSSAVRFP